MQRQEYLVVAMISDILGIFSLGSIVQCIVAKTGEMQRS